MNVAIFASAFYPNVGGVEELVRQLAHAYQSSGVRPIVITNRWPRSLPQYEEYEGIPTYRLPMRVPEGSLKAHLSYWLTHRRILRELLDILRDHRAQVLHIQCVTDNALYALEAKRILKLPLVVSAQGERTMDATGIFQRSRFRNVLLRKLLERADRLTACSRNTLDDLASYRGQPFAQPASVIYNGIRLEDFAGGRPYAHARPYILGIGRLVQQKGFDVLLKAFAQAFNEPVTADANAAPPAEERPDLLIAGEGAEADNLRRLSTELGLDGRVHFTGRADRATAVALFQGCSFVVVPSRQEPLGIVNLEAMAAGKAVISSNVGGIPELVTEGENGILFPAGDDGALVLALRRLTGDSALRRRLAEGGAARARLFAWPAIAGQYLDLYRELGVGRATPAQPQGPGDNVSELKCAAGAG